MVYFIQAYPSIPKKEEQSWLEALYNYPEILLENKWIQYNTEEVGSRLLEMKWKFERYFILKFY